MPIDELQEILETQVHQTRVNLARAARRAEVHNLETQLENRLAKLDQARSGLGPMPRRRMVGGRCCGLCVCPVLTKGVLSQFDHFSDIGTVRKCPFSLLRK